MIADEKRKYDMEGEMSFAEIGTRLGITAGGAWMLYHSAMRKLRKAHNKESVESLRSLVQMKMRRDV